MLVEVVLLAVVVFLIWQRWSKPRPGLPPSPPIKLPIIGHLPYFQFTNKGGNQRLQELYETYGQDAGAMSFEIGDYKAVVIGDFNLIKEASKNDDINFRHARQRGLDFLNYISDRDDNHGILFGWGKVWQEERRFFLSTLRDFGFGKSGMEDVIRDETLLFLDYMKELSKRNNGIVGMHNSFNICIVNCLWKLVAGYRFDYNDPELQALTAVVNETITTLAPNNRVTYMAFPLVEKLFSKKQYTYSRNAFVRLKELFQDSIENHERSYEQHDLKDFIDAYLAKLKKNDIARMPKGINMLKSLLTELFFAGSETTSSTLTWAILFMILYPDVQQKVREEVFDVVGHEDIPTTFHKRDMPFTEATIMEIQRCGNIAPYAVLHGAPEKATQIGKFRIPHNYIVYFNLTNIMTSDKYWDDPATFKPERHLDQSGKLKKNDYFIPFGTGKRQCPGENLAKAEIFILLTTLLQRFEFLPESPLKPPSTEALSGVTRVPIPFNARIKEIVAKP